MLFSRLASKLQNHYQAVESVILNDSLVSKLLFLGIEESYVPDALYVMFGEQAMTRYGFPHNLIVFYQNDQERGYLVDHFSHCSGLANLIYAPWGDHAQMINEAQDYLLRSQSQGDQYTNFLKMVIDGKDLSCLLAEGAKQCGRQLIALDISGKILGFSPKMDYLTEDWIAALKNGYCPRIEPGEYPDLIDLYNTYPAPLAGWTEAEVYDPAWKKEYTTTIWFNWTPARWVVDGIEADIAPANNT